MLHLEFQEMFCHPGGETGKRRFEKNLKHRAKRKQDAKGNKGIQMQAISNLRSTNLKSSLSLSEFSASTFLRQTPPFLELTTNPSQFSVYAAVRQCVLEKRLRQAALAYTQTFGRLTLENETEEDDEDTKHKDIVMKVISFLKIVNLS